MHAWIFRISIACTCRILFHLVGLVPCTFYLVSNLVNECHDLVLLLLILYIPHDSSTDHAENSDACSDEHIYTNLHIGIQHAWNTLVMRLPQASTTYIIFFVLTPDRDRKFSSFDKRLALKFPLTASTMV